MSPAFAAMVLTEFQKAVNSGSLKIVDLDPYIPVSCMVHCWENVNQAITSLAQLYPGDDQSDP